MDLKDIQQLEDPNLRIALLTKPNITFGEFLKEKEPIVDKKNYAFGYKNYFEEENATN